MSKKDKEVERQKAKQWIKDKLQYLYKMEDEIKEINEKIEDIKLSLINFDNIIKKELDE